MVVISGCGESISGELLSIGYVSAVLGVDGDQFKGAYMALIRCDDGACEQLTLAPSDNTIRELQE